MQINRKTKIYLAALIAVLILCVVASVWNSFFRGGKTVTVTQKRLTLQNFRNYTYTTDYTLTTEEIAFGETKDNFIYRPTGDDFAQSLRSAALKLGLSNEALNERTKIITWTKQGVNNLNGDYILYNSETMIVRAHYGTGINSSALESKDVYAAMTAFFGLPSHNVTITQNEKFEIFNTITYQAKIFGKPVYFNKADLNYSVISTANGRVTDFFSYLLPSEQQFSKDYELIPLKSFNQNTFSSLYAQAEFTPETPTGGSQFGTEFVFTSPANIGIRKFEPAYIYYNDPSEKKLLIPIFYISGVFTDAANVRGNAILLVVNQIQE